MYILLASSVFYPFSSMQVPRSELLEIQRSDFSITSAFDSTLLARALIPMDKYDSVVDMEVNPRRCVDAI
jgi:hypothetical protein